VARQECSIVKSAQTSILAVNCQQAANTWTNPFDLTLARKLNTYFGPARIRWNISR